MTQITETPGVQGGEPCVAGTRTPVRSVAVAYRLYHNRLRIREALPHLTLDQIEAALTYYQDHKARIDAIIRDQEAALRELEARG